jgi:thiol-disulfide isomerase/thioredoxin
MQAIGATVNKRMKEVMKRCFMVIAVILLTLNLHAQQLPVTAVMEIKSGKKVAFSSIFEKDKITLVSFWATWCVPGKREVKTISRKMADWKKQADFNYIAIAVDQEHTEDIAQTYALAQRWHFPCYIDPNSDLKQPLNFQALPYIMIIDKMGRVAYKHTGYLEGEQILTKLKEVAGAGLN